MSLLRKGAIRPLRSYINYALSFDGIDDYVKVPYSTSLDFTDELTMECWIKRTSDITLRPDQTPLGKDITYWWYMFLHTNTPWAVLWNTNGDNYIAQAPSELPLNTWAHFAATFKRNDKAVAYLNAEAGIPLATLDFPLGTDTNDIGIGYIAIDSQYFEGSIYEVRLYNRALSASEILHNKNAKTPVLNGLVLWLPINEGVGTTAHDKSGQGNNATVYGATWVRR